LRCNEAVAEAVEKRRNLSLAIWSAPRPNRGVQEICSRLWLSHSQSKISRGGNLVAARTIAIQEEHQCCAPQAEDLRRPNLRAGDR